MLIFSAVVLGAFKLADSRLYILKELDEIKRFFMSLSHYIYVYKMPVARAVEQLVVQNTYRSRFILQLYRELKSTNYFGTAYKNAVDFITYKKIVSAIEPLADILGICEAHTQALGIEQCCATFDKLLTEISEKYMSEAVLYRKLGVLSAMLAVIMIY